MIFLSKSILVWIISDIHLSYRITALSENSGLSRKPASPPDSNRPCLENRCLRRQRSVTIWCMGSEIPKPSPSSEAISVDPGLRETWKGRQERNETPPVSVLHKGTLTAVQQQYGWQGSTWRLQRASLLLKSIISASVTLRRPNGWKSVTHWFLFYRTKDI